MLGSLLPRSRPPFASLRTSGLASVIALALAAATLSACGTSEGPNRQDAGRAIPVNALDPWGEYVREASARFDVPEPWIRAVIEVESGGNTHVNGNPIVSRAGAMGLMQLMPDTWNYLRRRHGLGDDPHNPRDNILAGTAYLREMYDRFGAPGNFAAYNAGPRRMDEYAASGKPLPAETRNYIALIWPAVQGSQPRQLAPSENIRAVAIERPASGDRARRVQMAALAGGAYADMPVVAAAPRPSVSRIELASAPSAPPTASSPVIEAASPAVGGYQTAQVSTLPMPPTASRPVISAQEATRTAPARPLAPQGSQPAPAVPSVVLAARGGENWGVQVGAFRTRDQANQATRKATTLASALKGAKPSASEVVTNAGTLYRARLIGLDAQAAQEACKQISARGNDCRVLPPNQV
ncbi:MAG TPA: transglycosylase SLT domain-containing protein [Azospirillaceae bacterium]|nr:transglycosylase SLT domain-containing protein [Azospirillaceae bacterium]